jgi:phosphoenolpyruvate-protein kinase (PTS system EI component)
MNALYRSVEPRVVAAGTDAITQAIDSAAVLREQLRDVLAGATATEALILLPLIERAASLLNDVRALREARANDWK